MEVLPTGDLKLTTPPYDKEIEMDVLGVMLLESKKTAEFSNKLHEGLFYSPKNKIVFKAIYGLFKDGLPVDLLTVVDALRRSKKEDDYPYYCTLLTNRIASSAHFESWLAILERLYIVREVLKVSSKMYYSALNPEIDALDLLSKAQKAYSAITNSSFFSREKIFSDIVSETIDGIMIAAKSEDHIIGLKTGDQFIDKMMMGLVAPDLTIIAARPGEGKTTLAWNIVLNLAKQGIPVGVFSYEMKDRQLVWKTFSHYIHDTVNHIRSGRLGSDQFTRLENNLAEIKNLPIHINDSGTANVDEIKAVISGWIMKYGIKAVFIDYLQLIPPSIELRKATREAQISYNSRSVKTICLEYDISIVLLSQLSRQGANVEPELHHLRESGAIEQDADNVLFLDKDEEESKSYFGSWEEGSPEWITKFLLKKCRLGSKGWTSRVLNAAHNSFRDLEQTTDYLQPFNYRDFTESKKEETPF